MIFKDRKIKELEKQLADPNLTEEERDQINKQIEILKTGKSKTPFGWVIAGIVVIFIIAFSHLISLFITKKHAEAVRKNTQKVKPARYSTSDFIIKKKKQPVKRSKGYSKLETEFKTLKKKLKTNPISNLETAQHTISKSVGAGKFVIFVNPAYAKKIKSLEGYKSPQQIAQTALKIPQLQSQNNTQNMHKNILIPTGAVISAYTKYKLYSYNTKVPVVAIVSNPYSFEGKLIIPAGYEFMGSVSGHTKSRLNISFNKIINPANGQSMTVDAIGVMTNGSAGIVGNAHYHVIQNVLAGIGAGVLGAAAMFAGGGSAMNSSGAYTYQDNLRQNIAQNETSYAQSSLNNATQSNSQVVITLPAKTPIKIMFLKSLTR